MVEHISQDHFKEEVLENKGVVVVEFFATWCAPCKMLAPVLEELQAEMENVKIVKIDVDENGDVANQYGIQSIPTIKIFKNGADVNTKVGFLPKEVLKEAIKEAI